MKKILGIFALALVLTSCGSGASSDQSVDSTAAQIDTSAVTATDSTTAQIPAETPAEKVEEADGQVK